MRETTPEYSEGEIILTDAYESLGLHYVTAIMPAGVRKPKQKASAEGTVGNIATDIIAKLRNVTFHDFPTLKEAVARELKAWPQGQILRKEPSEYGKQNQCKAHSRA